MEITIVAAIAQDGVIGKGNALPWHLPEDLKQFKALTLQGWVVMGRRTFESIGKPLPKRQNLVLTRTPAWPVPGVRVVHDPQEAMTVAGQNGAQELFVIGGAMVYAAFATWATRMVISKVPLEIPQADAFFPDWDMSAWREVDRQPGDGFVRVEYRRF